MDLENERRARAMARLLAGLVIALSITVVAGYAIGAPLLVRIHPSLQGMSPLTAMGLAALSVAIVAASRGRERVVEGALFVGILINGAVLTTHFLYDADLLSPWVAQLLFGTPEGSAGRTSTGTALSLLLLTIGVAIRKRAPLSDFAAFGAFLVAATALLGYVYGANDLYALPIFRTMALHTAFALATLSIATMLVEPRIGWSSVFLSSYLGGDVTRRQLGLLLLPAVIGWVLQQGTAMQTLPTGAALVLLVILTFAPMALLVLRDGRAQIELDAQRRGHITAEAALARDLENRLSRKTEQLEHESAERSKMEAAMYRTQRVEAIGQLTGGIAHDFNNLLAAIGGNLELMLRKLPEEHLSRRYAVTAAAAVTKGAKLAGQLLAFSRSQRLAIQAIEVAPTLKRTRELIGTSLGPSIDILLEYSRDSLWAKTDPDQLELALFNLAVNARDAMPQGGQLRIESSVRSARIAAGSEEKPYVSIRVIDNGSGMTPEVQARAVEPFFTTRERGKGTGLGLAQVYGFVRQCEGDLVIESEPGVGTSVELLLPLGDAPIAEPTVRAPAPHAPTMDSERVRRLLVIDDDDAVRGVLVELLTEAGYEVSEAIDGITALAHLDEVRPDGAVIDFLMPGMNGAEVARRARARVPNLPVIFVSGYSDTVALDSIPGAVVLRKPFMGAQLQAAVTSALEARIEG